MEVSLLAYEQKLIALGKAQHNANPSHARDEARSADVKEFASENAFPSLDQVV